MYFVINIFFTYILEQNANQFLPFGLLWSEMTAGFSHKAGGFSDMADQL